MVDLQNALSIIAIAIACVSLAVSFRAYRQARNAAALSPRREAIIHVRNAIFDVTQDGNITAKTVASIRDALQISPLVFGSTVTSALDQAHGIAFRLQNKPSDRLTDRDENDKDLLADQLNNVLKAMNEEARLVSGASPR